MNGLSRRRFIGLAGGAGVLIAAGVAGPWLLGSAAATGELLTSQVPLPEPFQVPLPIPAVLAPVARDADADRYEIVQRRATAEILPGLRTPIWGYQGTFPGPTIESRSGRTTLWYHDHRMDFTGPAVYRGLAGFHIVRDAEEEALPLPRGERELPLMITDRAFAEDGSMRYPSIDRTLRTVPGVEEPYVEGVFGDVILVNGAPWPVAEVSATRHRLRVLNASNARRYDLALDPPQVFTQIGSDQGLLDVPRVHEHVPVAPAERYDLVVDFGAYPVGSEVTLVNRLGTGSTAHVMRFRVTRRETEDSHIPDRLSEIEPLDRAQATVTREFAFRGGRLGDRHGWVIDGQPYSPSRIDARPRLGDVEIWRFVADLHHPIHLHLVNFRVLSRGGHEPGPYDVGLKDTVDLRPGEAVEVIARFDGYRGRYMFHCHNIEHEDMGMMANFETI